MIQGKANGDETSNDAAEDGHTSVERREELEEAKRTNRRRVEKAFSPSFILVEKPFHLPLKKKKKSQANQRASRRKNFVFGCRGSGPVQNEQSARDTKNEQKKENA